MKFSQKSEAVGRGKGKSKLLSFFKNEKIFFIIGGKYAEI